DGGEGRDQAPGIGPVRLGRPHRRPVLVWRVRVPRPQLPRVEDVVGDIDAGVAHAVGCPPELEHLVGRQEGHGLVEPHARTSFAGGFAAPAERQAPAISSTVARVASRARVFSITASAYARGTPATASVATTTW